MKDKKVGTNSHLRCLRADSYGLHSFMSGIDCEIAAKVLAKRLEKVLPFIINPNQTGYIKGRFIVESIRLISDLVDYTKEKNIPGIVKRLTPSNGTALPRCLMCSSLRMISNAG